jgi:Cu(I)/Ag(I) efflux system membrane fusion protein
MAVRIPDSLGPGANGKSTPSDLSRTEGGLRAPPGLSLPGKVWWWFHFLILVKLARLRFLAILALVGVVILKWETLNAYYEKWTRSGAEEAVASADTEFYCPMHPQVIRDHPDKCPICGMPLSRRQKGDAADGEALPAGVIRRVQLTPYRVALAGIQTWEVGYRPLTKAIRTVGSVEFDERKLARIAVRVTGKSRIDKLYVNVTGQMVHEGDPLALLYSPDLVVTVQNLRDARRSGNGDLERIARDRLRLWGIEEDQIKHVLHTEKGTTHLVIRSPITGHVLRKYQVEGEYVEEGARLYDVADLSTVWVEAQVYEQDLAFLREGLEVCATTRAFPDREFRGRVAFLQPHLDAATRTLRARFDIRNRDHELRPGMYAAVRLEAPATRLPVFARALAQDWRNGVALDGLAHALAAPWGPSPGAGLGPLLTAVVRGSILGRGLVLAVPESAVIDTGSRRFVYREAWAGAYDCVEVELGPRAGDFYPVVRGLEAGERVVTAGSFLVDAETRLTAGATAVYTSGTGSGQAGGNGETGGPRPSTAEDEDSKVQAVLAKLSRSDRKLAEAQGYCPVLGNRLGAMGLPVKVFLKGESVFLCCKGCERRARAKPEQTLAEVARLRAGGHPGNPSTGSAEQGAVPVTAARGSRESRVQAALAKLSPEDRRLAEAQGFCAVENGNRLGAMGPPVKVEIEGEPVFLCCTGCEEEARAHPAQTLAAARRLKEKRQPAPSP